MRNRRSPYDHGQGSDPNVTLGAVSRYNPRTGKYEPFPKELWPGYITDLYDEDGHPLTLPIPRKP